MKFSSMLRVNRLWIVFAPEESSAQLGQLVLQCSAGCIGTCWKGPGVHIGVRRDTEG